MSVFIEVLEDGFTIASASRKAGELISLPDGFEPQSKAAQVERWGMPRYKTISAKEFEERGGASRPSETPGFTAPAPSPAPTRDLPPPAEASQVIEQEPPDEFADFDGLNIDETLSRVATFDDEKTARFIVWEKAHGDRKGVLSPLGASE